MMPVLDGAQTLAAMKADRALADVPVIVMSAAPESSIRAPASWARFLRKPFREPALTAAIDAVLRDGRPDK